MRLRSLAKDPRMPDPAKEETRPRKETERRKEARRRKERKATALAKPNRETLLLKGQAK